MKSSARLTLTLTLACLLGAAALVPTAALAQMNYQGLLTDSSGNPLPDGQYTLEFRLFTLATSGAEVWGPYTTDGNATAGKGPRVDLVAGRFNAILSAADAAGRTLANALSGTRFLQIKVGTNPAITPRQQLLAAPKALLADRADTVADGAIGTAQLADLQITGAKIADNTIPVSKLTGAGANFWDGNATDVWRPAGNVGIGTVASAAKLDVRGSGSAFPATSGSIQSAGLLQRMRDSTTAILDIGGIGSSGFWLQSTDFNNFASNYPLMLNPNGGNVGIGTTAPSARLQIGGSFSIFGNPPLAAYTTVPKTTVAETGLFAFGSSDAANPFWIDRSPGWPRDQCESDGDVSDGGN